MQWQQEESDEKDNEEGEFREVPADVPLPSPMYPSSMQELMPAQLTPQHLYHMIEGECSSIRQLACTNPARLSGLVWMELHQAKVRITQHIDREQRMQQQNVVSAAAAVVGGLTSEGFPLSRLLAPVPLTASKPGRPSSKRALAALEGVATKKVNAMLPSHMVIGGGEGGGSGAGKVKRAKTEVSKALHPPPVSIPVSSSAAADCSAAAADCSAASGLSARWTARGRLVVPPVVFE